MALLDCFQNFSVRSIAFASVHATDFWVVNCGTFRLNEAVLVTGATIIGPVGKSDIAREPSFKSRFWQWQFWSPTDTSAGFPGRQIFKLSLCPSAFRD